MCEISGERFCSVISVDSILVYSVISDGVGILVLMLGLRILFIGNLCLQQWLIIFE